jgi:hypothetical protein
VGDGDTADLTILAEDGQTVQRTLTNGVVSGANIRFQSQRPHPQFLGVVEETDYVVTLANSALTLNGASQLRPPPCCDIPNYFVYTNVVAVPMPELAIRVSEVELCWPAREGFRYQLQSCPDLVIGAWANVGPPLSGSGGVLCVTAKVLADAPPTFYRIVPGLGR